MSTLPLVIPDAAAARVTAIRELIRSVVPSKFEDCTSDDDLQLTVLSGGVTNQLYRVTSKKDPSAVVVARVFGKETDRIISRDAELFWQSQFLKTYGRCENGLVYEYLGGFKEFSPEEMPQFADVCAKSMAQFHVKATVAGMAVLPYATQQNFTEVSLVNWFEIAQSKECLDQIAGKSQEQKDIFEKLKLSEVAAEALQLLKVIQGRQGHLPQGCCHNDLLGANIMVKRAEDGKTLAPVDTTENFKANVRLIDFEYAHKNYLFYDIGNHFNEYGGLDADWSKYPSDAEALEFIRAYLKELHATTLANGGQSPTPFDEVVVLEDVKLFSMASHLCWTAWSVIQGAFSVIEFDYLTYANQRMDGYYLLKKSMKNLPF